MSNCVCKDVAEHEQELQQIISRYQGQPSALIEVLHQAQELIGYLPRQVQEKIADGLGITVNEVYSVISFYSHFSVKPKGEYNVCVCKGTACYVKGAPAVLERLEKELGIKAGDTTDDGKFSLNVVRCLGACGLGPVMTVNNSAHGLLKPDKAAEVIKSYA
ncbi:complex I 24 kDa subunit family protein [Zhaonella formicivorans]|uniref:NADH-quinone oxidoreductase subunit NuoE family protein n=1 Tax=Zhaonella formicivorans TaxID=2528593 RepID=UPI0010D05774|nr:NAD(P)H-dependent oxidoreductase subunit E [Zhaonella formicivorans]